MGVSQGSKGIKMKPISFASARADGLRRRGSPGPIAVLHCGHAALPGRLNEKRRPQNAGDIERKRGGILPKVDFQPSSIAALIVIAENKHFAICSSHVWGMGESPFSDAWVIFNDDVDIIESSSKWSIPRTLRIERRPQPSMAGSVSPPKKPWSDDSPAISTNVPTIISTWGSLGFSVSCHWLVPLLEGDGGAFS